MSDGTQSSLSTSDETSTITPGSSTIDSSTPGKEPAPACLEFHTFFSECAVGNVI
jgi:hypothetical protein